MSFSRKTVAVLAAALLATACGGSKGSISGKVLADGAPLAGQTVVLQGGEALRTATTSDDGSYAFGELDAQTYLLTVDVPSTLERHEQAPVAVSGAVQVPDLVFTGVTTVAGTVTTPDGAPVASATVLLLGTERSAVTDGAGAFSLGEVPVGDRTLSVTTPEGHAETVLTLVRGEPQTIPLQLTANPPGTVSGNVSFFSGQQAELITVTAVGSGVSTQAQPDGSYTLELPAGTWTLTATAPYYPTQTIGQVTVTSGATTSVEPSALSLYSPLPTFGLEGAYWTLLVDQSVDFRGRTASLLALTPVGAVPSFYRFDHQTHALRLVSVGSPPTLSPDGAWAAIPESEGYLLQNLSTGDTFTVSSLPPVAAISAPSDQVLFSPDDSHAAVEFSGSPGSVTSIDLSTGAAKRFDVYDQFTFGAHALLVDTSAASPHDWRLVGPAGVTLAFNDVSFVDANGNGPESVAVALEACATAPCPVDVLAPDRTTSVQAQGVTASTPPSITTWGGHWVVVNDGSLDHVINAEDGSAQTLPAGDADVAISPDGKRIAYTTDSGKSLYESALPLPASPTPVLTSTAAVRGAWVSFTRYVGYDDAPSTGEPYRFVIDSGALSRDADYTGGSGEVNANNPAVAKWLGSDGVSHVQAGGTDPLTAPNGETADPVDVAPELQLEIVDGLLAQNSGAHTAVTWDGTTTYVFGGDSTQTLTGLQPNFAYIVSGLLPMSGGSPIDYVVDQGTGQHVLLTEPGLPYPAFTNGVTVAGTQPTTLRVGPAAVDPLSGNPVGGVWALVPTVLP